MRDPINFKDHVVEHPGRFAETDLGEGIIELEPSPGAVIQQGTPLNASNMNKVDLSALEGNMIGLLYASLLKQMNNNLLSENNDAALATVKKITLTPTAGESWSTLGGCWYYKIGTRVHLHIAVSGLTADTNTELLTMPAGYRPAGIEAFAARGSTGSAFASLWFTTGGVVNVRSTDTNCVADIDYDAFS